MLNPSRTYKPTNLPWIDQIPKDWELIPVKHLFFLVTEKAPEGNSEELLSLYTHIGVKPRNELEERGNKNSTQDGYQVVKKGDIVINKMLAWMGAISLSEYDGVTSPAYDVLRPKSYVNAYFYHYLFRMPQMYSYFKVFSRGILDMKLRLYFEQLGQLKTIVPPYPEQNAIVKFLDEKLKLIDGYIEKKQKLITLLEEQKKAIINEAVTKGLDPTVKMKDTGIEWLGEVPEEWEVKRLKYCSEVKYSNVDKNFEVNEIPVKLCNYVDVYKNEYITETLDFMYGSATNNEIEKFRLISDDVIITKDSETANDIANAAYVPYYLPNTICGYHLAIMSSNKAFLGGKFLYYLFKTDQFHKQFELGANGVTRYGLGKSKINDAYIPLPNIEMQNRIALHLDLIVDSFENIKSKFKNQILNLESLKPSIISEAVTGKIDCRKYIEDTKP